MDLSQLVAPDPTQPPKRYDEVLDTYHKAKSMFPQDFGTMDVPTFAGHMNRITGTQDYAAGEGPDNALRRASGNITHELHHFGGTDTEGSFPSLSQLVGGPRSGIDLPEAARGGAEAVTRALGGSPELQKKVGGFGASVPRMAFDIGVPALLTAPIGGVGAIPGMAALSAASTYEETGSKTAAGISGAAGLLFPKAAQLGGQTLLKAVGAPTLAEMGPELLAKARGLLGDKAATDLAKGATRFATTLPEKTAKLVGSQVGMATTALGTEAAQIAARTDESWQEKLDSLGEMFSPSSLAVTALNQVPWTGIEAWHERGQPLAKVTVAIEPRMRQDFADRYVAAYKDKVGVEPSTTQVKQATDVAAGTVLASKQFGVDTTRPLRTSDGEWNPLEAIDSVKKAANGIALATPDLDIHVDQQHDPRIIVALRDIEATSGGKMNRDDMAREAALRVVHGIRTDSDMIGRVSPEYAELIRSSNDLAAKADKENEVNKQINQRIDPNHANFDPELARRIAAVSGTSEDRTDVGLPPLGLSTRDPENPQAFTPLDRNIIDTIRGKRNVVAPAEGEEQQMVYDDQRSLLTDRLASVQESIKVKETTTPPELHQSDSELEDLHVEEARTLQMLEQLAEPTTVEGTTRGDILTGDQSFAANEAALNYPKEVNWNDPRGVRSFYEYIKGAVRKAEIDWSRNTATETTVSRHPTLEAAQTEAKNLSASDPSGQVKYFTRNRPAKDGTFAVYKQDYSSTLSLNREDEGHIGEENAVTRALNKEQAEKFEMGGIPKSVFDALGEVEKELAKNEVQESFDRLNKLGDPGTREGYKAGFAQNVIDFISSLPESKLEAALTADLPANASGRSKSIRDVAFRKAQYIKFVQFLRDGGSVGMKVTKNKDGSVSIRPTGDLKAMNDYFGSLGYDTTNSNKTPFVDYKVQGMNFFEQFHVLTKLLKKELADPRWSEQRPLGDYGFIPRGFYEKLEDKLTNDWPIQQATPVSRSVNMWKDIPDTLEGNVLKMNDRKGNVKRLEVTKNPLLTAIVEGAKQKLTLSTGRLAELVEQSGHDHDPELLQLVKALTDAPFGKNIQVGFGIAKDPNAKGYYHYDTDALIGTGILLSPFSATDNPKFVRSIDNPKDILPHLVHELAHAHTVFGYHNDPEVKALVDETYNYVKQRHTDLMSVTKGEGFLQDTLHGLVSPQEMLATVFHDPQMMQFLKGIKDPFEPLPDQSEANLFGRVMAIVKRVFNKLLGNEGAGTMLQRVQQLATQAMARTEQIGGFRHEGDIYGRVESNMLREGDVLRSPTPQKPGLLESQTKVGPVYHGTNSQKVVGEHYEPLTVEDLQPTEERPLFSSLDSTGAGYTRGKKGQILSFYLEGNLANLDEVEKVAKSIGLDSDALIQQDANTYKLIKALKQAGFDGAQHYDQHHDTGDLMDAFVVWNKNSVKIGQTLESRTNNSLPLIDSMKAYSDHIVEEPDRIFFKPTDQPTFAKVFGPVLGQSNFVRRSGVWGYEVPKASLDAVTPEQVSQMPPPKVGMWAPSSFEALKTIFAKNGDSEQSSEAKAGWTMRFANLLKNNDTTEWSVLKETKRGDLKDSLGVAWMPDKAAALSTKIRNPLQAAYVVGHEATHTWGASSPEFRAWEPQEVRDAMDQVDKTFTGLSDLERRAVLQGLVNLSTVTGGAGLTMYPAALKSPAEFVSEFMAHTADVLVRAPKPNAYIQEALRLVPDDMSNLLQRVTLARATSLSALDNYIDRSSFMYGIKSDKPLDVVHELSAMFKGFAKSALETANNQAEFYRMRLMYPDMYREAVTASGVLPDGLLESRAENYVREGLKAIGLDRDQRAPTKPSLWNRTITQAALFVKQYPIARPFYDMLESVQGLERIRLMQVQTALAGAEHGTKLVSDERTKDLVKFAKTQTTRDKFSRIALEIQLLGDAKFKERLTEADGDIFGVQPVEITSPEQMSGFYDKYGVGPDERKQLETVFNGTRNQIKLLSAVMYQSQRFKTQGLAALALAKQVDLPPEAARKGAAQLMSGLDKLQMGDVQGATADLDAFNALVPDEKIRSGISDLVQQNYTRAQELERFLSVRMPYWMTERRFGDYGVWWRDKAGKLQSNYFKDAAQRDAFVRRENVEPIRQLNPQDKNFGVADDVFQQLDVINAKLSEKLKSMFGDAEGGRLGALLDTAEELRTVLNARDVLKTTTPRYQPTSRQYVDMFDAHQNYTQAVLSSAKSVQMKLEAELLLNAKEFNNQPIIRDLLNQHLTNVLKPDTTFGKTMSNVNFTYFMGLNLATMVQEPFQQLMGLAPLLTEGGTSWGKSYGLLKDANLAWLKARKTNGTFSDPEINSLMVRARSEGVVDYGPYTEIDHNTDLSLINRIRATGGLQMWGPFDVLKNRLYQGITLLRRFYGTVPAYNSEIAFIAGVMRGREQGLTGEDLYSEARFLVRQSMLGGGKVNRPIGLFSVNDRYGVGRSAAQTMWSLQSYQTSMITMMGRMIKESFSPKGLTPAQAVQVRKAAVQATVTQLALAGALGMPFVGAGMAVLQKMFPDQNIEASVREMIANFTGDDAAMGGWLGAALTSGVPNAFDQAPDMGSRFALGGVMGVSPYSGVGLQSFVGPTASVVTNVFKAMQAGARGDVPGTVENLAPRGMLRLFKAVEQGNTFMSNKGDMVANDLTPAERLGRFLGFTPARVRRIQDADRLSRIAVEAEKTKQTAWVSEQAEKVIGGKSDEVQRAVGERAEQTNRKSQDLISAIAEAVQAKTTPQDLRDFGNRQTGSGETTRRTLGNQTPALSHTDRTLMQQEIVQALGGRPSRSRVRRASLLDQLLEQYPGLTTPEASLRLPSRSGGGGLQSQGLLTPSALLQ